MSDKSNTGSRVGEWRRVIAFLDGQGVRFTDRDGDAIYAQGHALRIMGERYADALSREDRPS